MIEQRNNPESTDSGYKEKSQETVLRRTLCSCQQIKAIFYCSNHSPLLETIALGLFLPCSRQSYLTLGVFQPYSPIKKSELFQLLLIMPKKTYVSIICQPNSVVHDYLPATLIDSVVLNKHFSCLTPDLGLHCKTGFPWVSLGFILSLINCVNIVTPISKPLQLYLEA